MKNESERYVPLTHPDSPEVFAEKALQFVEGDRVFAAAVVEVGVGGAGNDQKLFVVGIFAVPV